MNENLWDHFSYLSHPWHLETERSLITIKDCVLLLHDHVDGISQLSMITKLFFTYHNKSLIQQPVSTYLFVILLSLFWFTSLSFWQSISQWYTICRSPMRGQKLLHSSCGMFNFTVIESFLTLQTGKASTCSWISKRQA